MANTYLFTGGGSGGHLYPGVAVANELLKKDPDSKVIFVGSKRGIEAKLLEKLNFKYHLLAIGPLNAVSVFQKFKSLLQLPIAITICMYLIWKYRPKHVLGFGGFASGPLMIAAILMGSPRSLWEGNAGAGLVTRKIARFMNFCFLAFQPKDNYFGAKNIELVGVPTRFPLLPKPLDRESDKKFEVFIFGGSQGSVAINNTIFDWVENSLLIKESKIKVIHQVGSYQYESVEHRFKDIDAYEMHEFIFDMETRYKKSDLIISRSGSSTITEIANTENVAILVPLPTAADNHQYKNAHELALKEAAILVEQKDFHWEFLENQVSKFVESPELLDQMRTQLKVFQSENTAIDIADKII
ncbi:MAG: undecaprenyldiphospho-muramoylpentapeptide beta-N-acetylglucosaminyltransferase [Bdellovibrionales bacterium]